MSPIWSRSAIDPNDHLWVGPSRHISEILTKFFQNSFKHKNNFALKFDLATVTGIYSSVAHIWLRIPAESQAKLLDLLPHLTPHKILGELYMIADFTNKAGHAVAPSTLAPISLSFEAIQNILRWWNGEISGARCAKNIVDSMVAIGGGVAGGMGGAAIGGMVGGNNNCCASSQNFLLISLSHPSFQVQLER